MHDILHDIITHKHDFLAQAEQQLPTDRLIARYVQMQADKQLPALPSMRQALEQSPTGIIAEFKRRSPSKGWFNAEAEAHSLPLAYAQSGAAAISVLTDEAFFGGRLGDLRNAYATIRAHRLPTPLLRKDFIISERQLYEARLLGASAVLLIAACLPFERYLELLQLAHQLGLEVLLEIHSPDELPYALTPVEMVGVNNRHLGTFHTDLATSFQLAPQLPADKLLVSESGISEPNTIATLRQEGFRGFLIGETFMRSTQPDAALRTFIQAIPASPAN